MTFDELGTALSELEETCKSAERELWSVRNRLERVEQLERDKDALREDFFGIAPDALDSLTPEERHDFYKLVTPSSGDLPELRLGDELGRRGRYTF